MNKAFIPIAMLALLAGCGSKQDLKPNVGSQLPGKPYGAAEAPAPLDLMTPQDQARPQRSDEVLIRSQERTEDKFDLPPT
ncbi:hypothetical protein [Sphingobium boeckii]|uniref:Uncharacterized protein n=1 Tax=Sphingobium boeckii TaxID=1082345 RepID=A0A7W9EET1_9SPHN|nr:hypothetical protein [Sphingobium boeckii]MBB5686583.1 hypothetical protein [Sphingobium boeckii]